MKGQTRRRTVGTQTKPNGTARQCGEAQPPVTNVSTPGTVSHMVPIILSLAILAILLAANISVDQPTMNSRLPGTPIVQQSSNAQRFAQ
ncbi:MAG: hypothetical protein M1343_10340 [Chloroflexi bacterium]|nr:hypothetical protein [Chloroflexota bacterium]